MFDLVFLAAAAIAVSGERFSLEIDAQPAKIDPGKSVILDVTLKTAPGAEDIAPPDIRHRLTGFSVAEDYEDEPVKEKDGSTVRTVHWKLVPVPGAEEYRIAPFAIGGKATKAFRFEAPGATSAPEGPVETDPAKDLPPLSWKLAGLAAGALAAAAAVLAALHFALRAVARRVRERRMSPAERARLELGRLLKRGLPGRGKYKDYYVELTLVVRRYVQRKYGLKAPHLTTEEFLSDQRFSGDASLREFLDSADMVKFAGVSATPEMADGAADSAKEYIDKDSQT